MSELPPNPRSSEWLEAVLATVSDAIYGVDRDWRMVMFNPAAEAYFQISRDEVIGRDLWAIFPQGLGTEYERACRAAMSERRSSALELPSLIRPERMVELHIAPAPDGGIAVSLSDITERRRAADALRAERDRNAEILESISDAFYAIDADWRFTYVNSVAERWWGRPREELIGKILPEEFPQMIGSASHEAHLVAARERRVVRVEIISPVIGRWIDVSIFPSDSGLAVYFRDISERKASEQRQSLLVNELNHRVKNSLAVVQALARQTLMGERTLEEARTLFGDRLMALSAAHDVITSERWSGAVLGEIVERSVLAHVDPPQRLKVAGPPLTITPKMALSLSLALHELVTNALKYGALSSPEGEIHLDWRLEAGADGRRLRMRWAETGGPAVRPPRRKGFGSRLIERALAADLGGTVRLDYAPAGVVCEIDAELPEAEPAPVML